MALWQSTFHWSGLHAAASTRPPADAATGPAASAGAGFTSTSGSFAGFDDSAIRYEWLVWQSYSQRLRLKAT